MENSNFKMSKAEETREWIIEKAAPLFNTQGYAGTSMRDIMEITELSKGCIYGHFKNKDQIALIIFDYNFNRITDYIKGKLLATDHSIERLRVYPHVYRSYQEVPFLQTGCPILNTATEADDTHPELRKRAAKALEVWKKALENQIKRGIARKEIKSETDATEFAVIMISMIEGAFMQAKASGRTTELTIAMNYLEKMILNIKN